ncbi:MULTISPECIES: hypothetical protein [unclassified Pseudomonas]|uniref:hypothetical protein n=1 Tax=unclassified Pseudomonas TaxID=196821 RepID=UPI00128F42EA|nr:hypothetical protein [Pseudomonas sp. MN1F]MQG93107.1 hypothetical protein [Pseudomonas sp. MN1F]
MLKKVASSILVAGALLASAQGALAEEKLFKNYVYQTPLAKFTKAAGYYDCSKDVGGTARCIDDVDFLEEKFTVALIFSGGKLMMVSLISPFDQNAYVKAIAGLSNSFTLVSMNDEKSILDVFDTARKSRSQEELTTKISNFEQVALASGSLTYTFLEGLSADGQTNAVSALAAAPENVRSAELVMVGQGAGAGMVIRFTFPRLEENKVLAEAKKPVESF